jgi:small subunit ribosomal protein S11
MLCRRAVVQHARGLRHISTQQDLLTELDKAVTRNAFNPLTGLPPAGTDDGGPPRPVGPQAYASPRENPFAYDKVAKWIPALPAARANYRFDCHCSRNNTITTLSSLTHSDDPFKPPSSKVIAWFSGGSVGFKKGQRASYEAGYQCAVRVFKLLEELKQTDTVHVDLYFKGFGQGREALRTALMAAEGDHIRETIKHVTDRTPLKIGGTRSKKTRRL